MHEMREAPWSAVAWYRFRSASLLAVEPCTVPWSQAASKLTDQNGSPPRRAALQRLGRKQVISFQTRCLGVFVVREVTG